MNTTKITESEISELRISALPTRPTAPTAFGGKGYTAKDMKAAFDKLPLYIIGKFNALLDDIASDDEGSLSAAIPTGISEDHTLRMLFSDITSGKFAEYVSLGDGTLAEYREEMALWVEDTNKNMEIFSAHIADSIISAGTPAQRKAGMGQ